MHGCRIDSCFCIVARLLRTLTRPPTFIITASLATKMIVQLTVRHPSLFGKLFLMSPLNGNSFNHSCHLDLPTLLTKAPKLSALLCRLKTTGRLTMQDFLSAFLFTSTDHVARRVIRTCLAYARRPGTRCTTLTSLGNAVDFSLSHCVNRLRAPVALILNRGSQFAPPTVAQQLTDLGPETVQTVRRVPGTKILPRLRHPTTIVSLLQPLIRNGWPAPRLR